MVHENRKFGLDTVYLPGSDPWRTDGIECIGYSEIGVSEYLTSISQQTMIKRLPRLSGGQEFGTLARRRQRSGGLSQQRRLSDRRQAGVGARHQALHLDRASRRTVLDSVTFTPANYEDSRRQFRRPSAMAASSKARPSRRTPSISRSWRQADRFRDFIYQRPAVVARFQRPALRAVAAELQYPHRRIRRRPQHRDGSVSLSPNALHHIGNEPS